MAFVIACLLLCLGFHPNALILLMSSCMFFDVAFPASSAYEFDVFGFHFFCDCFGYGFDGCLVF